jgi:outer membrane receptor for monomeric catechols
LVADATATLHLRRSLDIQVGLRNGFDRRYEDPIYLTVDRLRGDGRSVFVKLAWRLWE